MQYQPKVAANFKKKTSDTIQSIIVFIIIYMILVAFGIALTIASGYAGIMLILFKPMWFTLMAGAGLILMGLLVLIFLIKFIFHKSKTNVSHLILLKESDAPELFSLINNVATTVNTKKPKKVYLSSEVNAYVFYDSSFWSMFLPIKKNLTIGLGLMNCLTITEFKSILAHEFGHFSQRSMKIGSYTYNVNKVIYNMLYENDSYNLLKQQIAGWNSYVIFFANIATQIIGVIQKILQNLYKDINKNYMALSREMEFHADEVAASVTGSEPLITSLLRLDIAEESFQTVISYYNEKITDSVKTNLLFTRQKFVLELLGKDGEHQFKYGFPIIKKEETAKYNKSKLVVTDQWASHPSVLDRISALETLNLPTENCNNFPAIDLIPVTLAEKVTDHLFQHITYETTPTIDEIDDFKNDFLKKRKQFELPVLFNGYYDLKNPGIIEINLISPEKKPIEELFSKEMKDLIYNSFSLTNDINLLKQISLGNTEISSFDYDGEKYSATDANIILEKIEDDLQKVLDQLKENDSKIYGHFILLETEANGNKLLNNLYSEFMLLDNEFDEKSKLYTKLSESLSFIQYSTPFDEITQRFEIFKNNTEPEFREILKKMLGRPVYNSVFSDEEKKLLNQYINTEISYFDGKKYDDNALQVLLTVLEIFRVTPSKAYFYQKKQLLEYFSDLHAKSS